jgi:hypothetical protein
LQERLDWNPVQEVAVGDLEQEEKGHVNGDKSQQIGSTEFEDEGYDERKATE